MGKDKKFDEEDYVLRKWTFEQMFQPYAEEALKRERFFAEKELRELKIDSSGSEYSIFVSFVALIVSIVAQMEKDALDWMMLLLAMTAVFLNVLFELKKKKQYREKSPEIYLKIQVIDEILEKRQAP